MWSVLATSWRVVVRRAVADRVILLAALITILLAAMLVASGPIYADAVSLSAVRRTLADAEVEDANAEITVRTMAADYGAANERVTAEVARAFALTGGTIRRRGTSDSYALPDQPGETVTDLTVFRFFDQFESYAALTSGAWPDSGATPPEVAVPESVAATLGFEIGDELELTNRRDTDVLITIQVSGTYRVTNPQDPYWYGDELDTTGVEVGSSFTTYGPFLVTSGTFFESMTPFSSEINWRVYPIHDNLTVSEVAPLRREIESLEGRLNVGRSSGNRMRVETGLIQILRETERSLLVTRSSVLILTIQLAVLAGYALLLTAGLLVESRQIETNLLRSRGAASNQILAMAVMEGILLTIPAAIAAPYLATFVLRTFNLAGPLSEIELVINPVVTRTSFIVAGVAALGCLIALAYPALRAARQFGDVRSARSRESARSIVQRAGLDIGLLVIALIGFWQLRRFGAPITETVQGRLGIDPLLVAAPALGLLAGGVVALRTLPLISKLAESATTRSRLLVPALSAWQVARRPLRYARAALLLMLATGIGLFSVSYATTWRASQSDQAEFQTGAQLRVEPDRRIGSAVPYWTIRDAYQDLPGFVEAMPVQREFGELSRSSSTARFVILDADRAVETVLLRPDLADGTLEDLMDRIAASRIEPLAVDLPGQPGRIAIDVAFEVDPLPPGLVIPDDVRPSRLEFSGAMRVALIDADGQIFKIDMGAIPATGEPVRLVGTLSHQLDDGSRLRPAYPLQLLAIEMRAAAPQDVPRTARLNLESVHVSPDDEGDGWQPVPVDFSVEDWDVSVTDLALARERPAIAPAPGEGGGLSLDIFSGATTSETAIPLVFGFELANSPTIEVLPVLISSELMAQGGLEIGDTLPLPSLPGYDGDGEVVGTIDEFPTVDPDRGEPIVVDRRSYLAASFDPGETPVPPDEYWMTIEEESIDVVTDMLGEAPYLSAEVHSRDERETTLQSDPVALGTIGSLMLGFIAAAVFAGIGFAVNAAVSARERLVEFALLRAVGLSNRQLVAWLGLENALLVAFGLIGGTLLGIALAWLVLPLIAITQEATVAVPEVIVVYPWDTIFWLELSLIVVLAAAVGLLAVMLRRMGLGALLRLGEE